MEKNKIQIKIKSEDLKGVYSNSVLVSGKKEEFVLDFLMLSSLGGVLSSRVIVSPDHLKRIVKVLQDNIEKYEKQFGKIESSQEVEEAKEKIGFVTE